MATNNLALRAAVLALAGGMGAGCIEPDCAETYFLDTPQTTVENGLGGRVHDIALELKTDQRPFVPAQYRGIPVGSNLSIYCAPVDRNGNFSDSGCQDGKGFEFFISFISPEGNVLRDFDEDRAGTWVYNQEDIVLKGQPDFTVKCSVWRPPCAIGGRYIDEQGRTQYSDWGQRTLIGNAEAGIVTEMLCPAPMSDFEPVDDAYRH